MAEQKPLEPWLNPKFHSHHAYHPLHVFSQLWSLHSDQLPPGAQGAMWLELLNSSTLVLLTLGLVISAIGLLSYAIRSRSHGNVHLPPDGTESLAPDATRKVAFARSLIDNLDHDLGEDGDPLDLDAFWSDIRASKSLIGVLAMALLAVRITPMVATRHAIDPLSGVLPAWFDRLGAPAYCLILWTILLFTRSPRAHSLLVWNLFTVSVLSAAHEYLFVIGPSLVLTGVHQNPDIHRLYSLLLTVLLVIAIGTIRTGPEVFRERHRLYTPAVTNKLKEVGEAVQSNVIGSGDSIIGSFMSTSTFRLMRQISSYEQVDVHELPVLPANLQTEPTTIATDPRADTLVSRFGKTASLIKEIVRPNRILYLKHFSCVILEVLLAYVPHFCLQQLLLILDGGPSRNGALAYSALWIVASGTESIARITQTYDYCYLQIDRSVRNHLSFVLFRKLLSRNTYYKPKTDASATSDIAQSKADILNLMSSDAREVEYLPYTLTNFARLILQLAIGCTYIWTILGPSGLWGIGFSFVTYPLAYLLARWEYRIHKTLKINSDKRLSLLQEAFQTISMIKMMASERFWFNRLNNVRQEGFRLHLKSRLISVLSGLLYSLGPTLVIVVAFAHYTLIAKHELTASIAFTSIAVFSETRSALTSMPQKISDLMNQLLGAKRIALFLRTPDVEYLSETVTSMDVASETQPLTIDGDVTWTSSTSSSSEASEDDIFTLRDLSLSFERGQMILIAGKYGSGKSLLLLALLGEVKLLRGKINYALSPIFDPWQTEQQVEWSETLEGLAYAPQVPWLQSLSIRENILFGLPLNVERYKKVLFACALIPDLDVLEDSDLTEIGERGKILSGGQKARVSLARAVYSRASTVLLDDVISAVDAQTSQHILKHCFQSPLMVGRTIIIASHAVESLAPLANKAIFLEDGTAKWQGRGSDLLESEYMAHLKTDGSSESLATQSVPAATTSTTFVEMSRQSDLSRKGLQDFVVQRAPLKTPRQVLVDENKIKGAIDAKYWIELIRLNGGSLFFAVYIGLSLLTMLAPVVTGVILKAWTTHQWSLSLGQWVTLFSMSSVLTTLILSMTTLVYWYGGWTARKEIYATMQDRVLRAKLSFFTKTRVGSITQRFGLDLVNSLHCSIYVGSALHLALSILISVGTITYYAGWPVPAGLILIVVLSWKPSRWYRSSSRQIRRLTAATYGPVNAMFAETTAGAAVIRAFGAQSIFVRDMIKTTNLSQSCFLLSLMHSRWLNILTSTGYVIVLSCTLAFIIHSPAMKGGQAGFILGFAESITFQLVRSMDLLRTFETHGVSLERLAEYRNLEIEDIDPLNEPEKDRGDEDVRLASWPGAGRIEATDLSARYAPDMPEILHKVSFSCMGGQRVGIVGATGGGKSTLAKALFRFVDITGGTIRIDDEDISKIPLGILRSRMGIIAQDPILVSGTLRLNLDLEGQYSDQDLTQALRQVQLIGPDEDAEGTSSETSSITVVGPEHAQSGKGLDRQSPVNVFDNLDYEIESGGQNLSAGQKQLVVMARALLKKHKILVLDEATASIDSKTDAEISRVVHEEFEEATVLIIAHRLRTIMPCSKILVMDQGNVVQQGTPHELIQEEGGKFQSLCKAAGEEEYRHLQHLAQDSLLVRI